jgi:methyl-accepting chemotaxis protein
MGILLGFLFSLGFVGLAILVSLLVSKSFAEPLLHLGRVIRRIASGDITERVSMKSATRELSALSDIFDNDLIGPFREILVSVKDLIARNGGEPGLFDVRGADHCQRISDQHEDRGYTGEAGQAGREHIRRFRIG